MNLIFILSIFLVPFLLGTAIFRYIGNSREVLGFNLYVFVQSVVIGLLLSPTFYAYGHGGVPTNLLAGVVAVFFTTGIEATISGLVFGSSSGPVVYLEPGLWGAAISVFLKCLKRIRP